jgi:hypothetical protein
MIKIVFGDHYSRIQTMYIGVAKYKRIYKLNYIVNAIHL